MQLIPKYKASFVLQTGAEKKITFKSPQNVLSMDLAAFLIGSPGDSAYEVAVRNGFVGTEADWLASLQGGGGGGSVSTPIFSAPFADQINVPPLSMAVSNTATLSGTAGDIWPIFVRGGEISFDGGVTWSTEGHAIAGDTVTLRQMADAAPLTSTAITLYYPGGFTNWTITTAAVVFSPLDLFQAGELGLWYEPDTTTCFIDTAGTSPANVGDPVARMNDLSGNGMHALQATVASRPILRQAGSLFYLETNGTNQFMTTAALNLIGVSRLTVCAGARKLHPAGTAGPVVTSSSSGSAEAGTFSMYAPHLVADREFAWAVADNALNFVAIDEGLSAPLDFVMTMNTNLTQSTAGTRINPRLNGVDKTAFSFSIENSGLASFKNAPIIIGKQATNHFSGRLSALVIRAAATSGLDVAFLENYIANKAGVTL